MADVSTGSPKKVEAENNSNNNAAPASPKPGPVVDQAQGEDRRTVFVKGIPQNYNEEQLCTLFQAFGVVESSRIMVDQQTSQILDKGFVTFKTQQEAQTAVENLDGHKIADKTITCKISSQRNQSPMRISQGNNLYIRNLSPSVTDHDLKQMFHPFGNVLKCKVICDKQTGVSRQIGLVLFERREDAVAALEQMNGKKVDETSGPLAIQFAETETQRNARKNRNGAPLSPSFVPISPPVLMPGLMPVDMYPVSPPMGYFYDPYYPEPVFQPIPAPPGAYYGPGGAGPFLIPHPHAHPIPHPHPIPIPHPHHPHPSDHGPESSNQASANDGAVIPVHHPHPHPHPHPQPIPYQPMPQPIAFPSHPIPFPRPRSSSYDAMAEYYQNHSPMGSPVFISPMGSPIQHHVFPILPPMHPQASPGSPAHSTEHPPSSPVRSRFSHQPNENTNLFVFHLPSNIDDDGLRVMFEKFGKLESVRVITDKESSESRGYGFVKFANAEDAQAAIKQMNGMQVGNKHLKVSLKTPTPSSSPRLQRYSTGSNGASPPQHSPSSSPSSSPHSSPGPSPILPRRSSAPIAPQIHRTHT